MYTVKYKHNKSFFWSKLKNVKGDGFVEGNRSIRFFILEDESRVEICTDNMIFKFDNGRFMSIKKEMEKQVGQNIVV